jgi:hypothetical protein
LLYA